MIYGGDLLEGSSGGLGEVPEVGEAPFLVYQELGHGAHDSEEVQDRIPALGVSEAGKEGRYSGIG